MNTEQLFYISAGSLSLLSVLGTAFLLVWAFGGKKIRQQIKDELK